MSDTRRRPKNVDDIYPLSPMQQLMLLHALAAPESRSLANQLCCRLVGELDIDAFRASWEDAVARHPALRSAFVWEGLDRPLQAVRSTVRLPFDVIDLRAEVGRSIGRPIDRLREADRDRRYDLTQAPLTRLTLARVADREYFLIWNVHHLVADRWCFDQLLEDLRQSYLHRLKGRPRATSAPGVYRDYIAWIGRQDPKAAESYWRATLSGLVRPTLVDAERRHTRGDGQGRLTVVHRPPPDTLGRLRGQAAAWRASAGAAILTAIAATVAQQSRRSDVVFGLTVSGRPVDLPSAETVVGSFINNLPLRIDLTTRDQPLPDLLREVQKAQARRMPYEYVSLADVHSWSGLSGSSPLFDLLAVINLDEPTVRPWPGLEFFPEAGSLDGAYPFVLGVGSEEGRLQLSMTSANPPVAEAFLVRLSETMARIASAQVKRTGDLVALEHPLAGSPAIGSEPSRTPAPAITAVETVLAAWREVMATEDISIDDDLLARGATSLQVAQAFAIVERRLGRGLPLATLFRAPTVRGLIQALGEPAEPQGALVSIRASGTRPPIFVVPGIGGEVVGLATLARAMSPDQPFHGLQSRGLDGREAPRTDIGLIAREYVADVSPAINGPYALLGVCWGAAVAFEMARALAAAGRPPGLVVLLDPANVRGDTLGVPRSSPRVQFLSKRLRLYRKELRHASIRESLRFVASKARHAARILTDRAAAQMTRTDFLRDQVHAANLRAILGYSPVSSYQGASVLVLTSERTGPATEARLDWRDFLEPAPRVRYVAGSNSGDALTAENAADLVRVLEDELGCLGKT